MEIQNNKNLSPFTLLASPSIGSAIGLHPKDNNRAKKISELRESLKLRTLNFYSLAGAPRPKHA